MSKEQVYDYLRRHRGWNTAAQISAGVGIEHRSVCANLARLKHDKMVECVTRTLRHEVWQDGAPKMHTSPLPIYRLIVRSAHEYP